MMLTMSQNHGPFIHGLPPAHDGGDIDWQQHYGAVPQAQPQHDAAARPQGPPVTVIPQPGPAEVKPRLSKQQHDILEAHFRKCPKPSTVTKKGFAAQLGVPLEKVNNWFQNRRAKVKQDAKKQQNISNMQLYHGMQAQQAFSHPQQASLSLSYPANSALAGQDVSPTSIPQDMVVPQAEVSAMHSGLSAPQEFGPPLHSISESTRPGSSENIMQSLYAAGYNVPSGSASAMAPNAMFDPSQGGFQDNFGHGAHDGVDFEGSRLMVPFESDNSMGNFDFNMNAYECAGSSPEKTDSLVGTISSSTSPFSNSQSAPSLLPTSAEGDPMGSYGSWGDATMQQLSYDASSNDAKMAQSTHHLQVPVPEFNQPSNMPSLDLSKAEEFDSDASFQGHLSVSPDRHDSGLPSVYDRRNSSTSALAESMSTVGIQSHQSPADAEFKQPAPPSNIAARRQRPRPAALSATSLRSASYSAGMPTSPGPPHSADNDQTLRRIRSSGIPNGRISKNAAGPAQRSPLSFTFAESAASPKFTRHPSFQLVTSPTGNESLAPPTPLTPNEMGQFPPWQNAGQATTQAGTSDFSGGESFNPPSAYSVSAAGSIPNMSSPPHTPLDAAQFAQYRHQFSNGPVFHNTPPQSAPPTQQSFPRAPMPSNLSSGSGYLNPNEFPGMDSREAQMHLRRPSLPDTVFMHGGVHQVQGSVPTVTAAGDIHVAYPLQYAPEQMHVMMQQQQHFGAPQVAHDGLMVPASMGPPRPASSMPDLFVHEYTPPHVRGQTPPPRQDSGPKNYIFTNTGPEAYKKRSEQD